MIEQAEGSRQDENKGNDPGITVTKEGLWKEPAYDCMGGTFE